MSGINRCAYALQIIDDQVQCACPKMLHQGWLYLSDCDECPYHKQPDYATANSRLYTLQQSAGVYVPRPRSCGGCGTVKRRVDAMQFVWPYWHAGASGDELRWSIRSVEQHF